MRTFGLVVGGVSPDLWIAHVMSKATAQNQSAGGEHCHTGACSCSPPGWKRLLDQLPCNRCSLGWCKSRPLAPRRTAK